MFVILRRAKGKVFQKIEFGDIVINLQKRNIQKNGKEVHMPLKEFLILEYLITHEGVAVSRADIIEYIW